MFRLYKHERTVFTFDDYGGLLEETKRSKPKTVLEFGPGNSTLAWVEAGCSDIVTLEHDPKWREIARRNLSQFRNVHILPYKNRAEVDIPEVNGRKFDLIFVDSPAHTCEFPGMEGCTRFNTLRFALGRAPVVLLHDARRIGEQASLNRIYNEGGYDIEMIYTKKGMARITPSQVNVQ